jgi:hypothetical protein
MTLKVDEFVRRFLVQTLPSGFQRIRYFGSRPIVSVKDFRYCPKCHTGILVRMAILPAYRSPERLPDSS